MRRSCRASLPSALRSLSLCPYALVSACEALCWEEVCRLLPLELRCALPCDGVCRVLPPHVLFKPRSLYGSCSPGLLVRLVALGYCAGRPLVEALLRIPRLAP